MDFKPNLLASLLAGILLSGCSGGSNENNTTPPVYVNTPPVVDAGSAQIVAKESQVTLIGSATDNGSVASVNWEQVSGAAVELITISDHEVNFIAPAVTEDTELVFKFTATDNEGASNTAEVVVTVLNDRPPEVQAIVWEQVEQGQRLVLYHEAEDNGTIVAHGWRQLSGPEIKLLEPVQFDFVHRAAVYTFAPEVEQDSEMVLEYWAVDENGFEGKVSATVKVTAKSRPLVYAGPNVTAKPGEIVTIQGETLDLDDEVVAVKWQSHNGIELSNGNSLTAEFVMPEQSGLRFDLEATDASGQKVSDYIFVFQSQSEMKVPNGANASVYDLDDNSSSDLLSWDNKFVYAAKNTGELSFAQSYTLHEQPLTNTIESAFWLDFDGDGKEDLLVANERGFLLRKQSADGNLSAAVNLSADWHLPFSLCMPNDERIVEPVFADIDQDGHLDIVWSNRCMTWYHYPSDNLYFAKGTADGRFAQPQFVGIFEANDLLLLTYARPYNIEALDIDNDGLKEVVVTSGIVSNGLPVSHNAEIFQLEDNRLHKAKSVSLLYPEFRETKGRWLDVNKDGLPDLIDYIAAQPGDDLLPAVRVNQGNFNFAEPEIIESEVVFDWKADLDGDGLTDLLYSEENTDDGSFRLYRQRQTVNGYQSPVKVVQIENAQYVDFKIKVKDIDGDGDADIFVTDHRGNGSFYTNDGKGVFTLLD